MFFIKRQAYYTDEEDNMRSQEGLSKLYDVISGKVPHASMYNFDDEAEFIGTLKDLEYINIFEFDTDMYDNQAHMRTRIRYLAALFPDADIVILAKKLHGLINNSNLEEGKLRLMLLGKKMSNPQQDTNEVRIRIIQGIGKCLQQGMSVRATAREMNVSYDTVESIENYLGIRKKFKDNLQQKAIDAYRDNVSIRNFSLQNNISTTLTRKLYIKSKEVLIELGEING